MDFHFKISCPVVSGHFHSEQPLVPYSGIVSDCQCAADNCAGGIVVCCSHPSVFHLLLEQTKSVDPSAALKFRNYCNH